MKVTRDQWHALLREQAKRSGELATASHELMRAQRAYDTANARYEETWRKIHEAEVQS